MNSQDQPRTLFDKLWDAHVIAEVAPGMSMLYVDRHYIHDLGGNDALVEIERRGLTVRRPDKVIAVPDHVVSSDPGRAQGGAEWSIRRIDALRDYSQKWKIRYFDVEDPEQGIVHVMGPELGLTVPGLLVLCGDSHTSTHGALGTLAWGIGASEIVQVLATQTIIQRRPKRMRVRFDGMLTPGVEPKDIILHLIGKIGASGGDGYAVEYSGEVVCAMDLEGRMTLCNLSIELGAKIGLVAPDDQTLDYVATRRFAPKGASLDLAMVYWKTLATDQNAVFDKEIVIDVSSVAPQITWGTSPQDVISIEGCVPQLQDSTDESSLRARTEAMQYMGLAPGQAIAGTRIDRVFIGSCANSRLSDLRRAASVVSGRHVAPHVEAWVVPGSKAVKLASEKEGLDRIFREAGFQWREPGCSQCVGANGDLIAPGQRCVSTSNRNFVGRQGPGARTHLSSASMAAAAAIAGAITDVRTMLS